MKIRFLLPCSTTPNREAINAAIELANSYGATLIPLLLRSTSKPEHVEMVQPENGQPQHNFLEIVQHQATIMDVPIEEFEITTHDAGRSIRAFAEEMDCSGILLFVYEGRGVLLESNEVRYMIEHEHIILLFLVRLIPEKGASSLSSRISHQFQSKQSKGIPRRKKAFPPWYPFALLAAGLSIAVLVCLNGLYLFKEPMFSLASFLVKLIFICVITLTLITLLKFFVEKWRQDQE